MKAYESNWTEVMTMRENIGLYRGKREDTGHWKEGNYICLNDGGKGLHIIVDEHGEYHRINSETLGEYTGLTDKNGVKIFEGDIVRYGDTVHKVVFEQRNETAYFGLAYSTIETLPFGYYQDLRQLEVIGNIHDNPELLELGKENT